MLALVIPAGDQFEHLGLASGQAPAATRYGLRNPQDDQGPGPKLAPWNEVTSHVGPFRPFSLHEAA